MARYVERIPPQVLTWVDAHGTTRNITGSIPTPTRRMVGSPASWRAEIVQVQPPAELFPAGGQMKSRLG